ncbi:MAG: molybdopterin dinucleotide binding domain-containing protein [Gemmataceae bacterium]
MPPSFILIPGRTARQGTTLNEGKLTDDYRDEISTLQVNPNDLKRLGIAAGDRVRVRSEFGAVEVVCQAAKEADLPEGLLFLPYGDASSRLMGADTHGTGMPTSKCFDVELEKLP